MQHIDLICIGKLNAAWCAEGVAEYRKRLSTLCDFRVIELPEQPLREDSPALVQRALEKEAQAILASVRKGAAIVALCVEGKTLSSEELLPGWTTGR